MIDAHAHMFPTPDEQTRRLPPSVGALVGGLAAGLRRWVPELPLGVERLAAMRRHGPARLHAVAEQAMSVALAPQVLLRGSPDDLLASMDRLGIERTVVIAGPPYAPNHWLLGQAAAASARLVPVTTLPRVPEGSDEAAWADAFRALGRDGARGFKIHPNADGLPADHAAYRALFAVADELGKFVILHTGCFAVLGYKHLRPADAREFAPLFARHPSVRVCLAHMNRDRPDEAWALMREFPQLVTDTSWQPVEAVRRAVDEVGAERVLLGSDWPLLHSDLQGEAVRIVEAALTGAAREQVARESARKFLGED
jgi:predicted TIM-barrel fold metal-dependent hydrolase